MEHYLIYKFRYLNKKIFIMNTEKNILIAEFLGRCGKVNKNLYTWKGIDYIIVNDAWVRPDEMLFDKNWNWLIFALKEFENRVAKNWGAEILNDFIKARNEALINLNREKLYDILVINIEWYNRNSKKKFHVSN